ncbi:MAG: Flp family type IVb pilin [Desulfoarculaceae bacterium]|nr:Flp family type IVb pilin [Desulfoarculaceae bacterium]
MKALTTRIGRFLREEDGVTAIEYGLIAAGIAVAIILTVFLIGEKLDDVFNKILDELKKVA